MPVEPPQRKDLQSNQGYIYQSKTIISDPEGNKPCNLIIKFYVINTNCSLSFRVSTFLVRHFN